MIEDLLTAEKEKLISICYAKNTISNIKYKIMKDENCRKFFKELHTKAVNYDNLEYMEKYYFNNDIKAFLPILNLLLEAARQLPHISKLTGIEIIKPYTSFSDYGGKELMYILSHIPIMKLILEKINYEKQVEISSRDFNTYKTMQSEKLDVTKLNACKFPNDDDIIDYDLKKMVAEKRAKEYNNGIKDKINEDINTLCTTIDETKSIYEQKVLIGCVIWDKTMNKEDKNADAIKEVLTSMSASIDKSQQNKVKKLEKILKTEFMDITDAIIRVDINRDKSLIHVETRRKITDDEVLKMRKIFILKKDFELTTITLKSNEPNVLIFNCEMEL